VPDPTSEYRYKAVFVKRQFEPPALLESNDEENGENDDRREAFREDWEGVSWYNDAANVAIEDTKALD
jgi:hypothetical protein